MTDKEFKRLSRPQLIDIMYQLQLKVEELTEENQQLKEELENKRLRIQQAGSIADAALDINGVFQAAQRAADQYLEEVRILHVETELSCQRILQEARREAEEVVARAQNNPGIGGFAAEYENAENAAGEKE